ncbi:response regulator [Flavobacteriaceae bacterium XHP0103]|uniref:hybrid sensor histidine kinase/response regulator transcription factor n=1 Tax=Marixanthotalea marina TaxID=2844359 RepID=UPI002989EFBC|nr:two-component regulator propeller domain-containing protein [Marixanthotalea marina]MBU3822950.1 response regulator [Marixanthotalea marina]
MGKLKLLFLYFFPYLVYSQISEKQFAFGSLTIKEGLSQNSVISMAQDSIGYMWFATQDGLNRYDGKNFKVFNKQFEDITRPTFSKLGKVYIDKENSIWIVSNSGVLEKLDSTANSFKTISSLKNVSTIYQDQNLNYYIGTYNSGLFKIDAKTKDTLQVFPSSELSTTVYDFFEQKDEIYIAASGAVFTLEKNKTLQLKKVYEQKGINFSCIEVSKDGTIWLGSYGNGLFFKTPNQNTFTAINKNDLPADLNIEDILVDEKNRLWIATYGKGVYLYDLNTGKVQNFLANKDNPFDLHYNDILSIFEDNTGVIWFGSDGAGASYYDEHLIKFNVLTNSQLPKEVNVDVVRSITSNNDNKLWVGTSGKGLTFMDLKSHIYKTYTTENTPGLNSNRIVSLDYNDEALWVGHQGFGLNVLENGTYRNFPEISNFTVWRIINVSDTSSWLCTERNGLVHFDKEKGILKQFNEDNTNLTSNNIRAIAIDDNIVWIGTEGKGLFKLDTKTGECIKIDAINDPIKSLLLVDNLLWVGTYGNGLKSYNLGSGETKTFSIANGLPNNVIYGILPDNNGDLWLSSNYGLSKFSPNNNEPPLIKNYTDADGLQNLEFNTGAYYQDINGTIYFGGLDGINWFNPDQLTINTVQPKTIISSFDVFSKPYPLNEGQALYHDENTVTFSFSSLHFSAPDRNQYKYQLVNHDSTWVEAKNNNIAHYTNLPPNNYVFRVKSSNYDGVWNNTPATFGFTILKPWYQTNLSIAIYILAFILLLALIYRYLNWRWYVKNQLRLEQEETVRLKKIDELKTKLYTNISHEIRTPLTLILGPLENQLSKENISKEDSKELSLVKSNANRLLNLVNQMLDLSVIDSGKQQLKISKGNLTMTLQQAVEAFQYRAKEKKIEIQSSIQGLKSAWFDKDVIEKVVYNLLSNAVKYSPDKGTVLFKAHRLDNMMVLSVINETAQVTKSDLNKLFNRFYQENEASDGVGVGLALVKELVNLSKGTIIANNLDVDKIQFTVTLPIEKSAFNEKELIVGDNFQPKPETTNNENNKTKQPVLLIVEDDKDIRNFVASIFKGEYKIEKARDGKEGIDKALEILPDVIVSDIMMPNKNGLELCETIKTDALTSHIPVVLLTAKVGEEHEIFGFKTGADAYITKPFSSEKLKIVVEKLLETRQKLEKHYSKTFSINPNLAITSVENDFLQRLKTVLETHITETSFSSDKFSKLMNMSRTQLHRKLHAIVGMSTTEFIRSQRLKQAIEILKNTDLTIAEIAYKVGFNTPSYFNKCFKEAYGCTPQEYQGK